MECTCDVGITSRFMTPAAAQHTGRVIAQNPRAVAAFCAHLNRAAAGTKRCCASQLLPCLAVADAALKTSPAARARIAGLLASLWSRRALQRALARQPRVVCRVAWLLVAHWVRLLVLPANALHSSGARPCREVRTAAMVLPERTAARSAVERERRTRVVADALTWLDALPAPARSPSLRASGTPREQCMDCGQTAASWFLDAPFDVWVQSPCCSRKCAGTHEQKATLYGVIKP